MHVPYVERNHHNDFDIFTISIDRFIHDAIHFMLTGEIQY